MDVIQKLVFWFLFFCTFKYTNCITKNLKENRTRKLVTSLIKLNKKWWLEISELIVFSNQSITHTHNQNM